MAQWLLITSVIFLASTLQSMTGFGFAVLGLQAQLESCHAGHDGDHPKYQIMSGPMRIARRGNGFTHYDST